MPTFNPWSCGVETVTTEPGVFPSPDIILPPDTGIGSEANAPTISNSILCLANPRVFDGYFWSISLPDAKLKALDSLL